MKNSKAKYTTVKQEIEKRLKISIAAGISHHVMSVRGKGNDVEIELPNDHQYRLFRKHIAKMPGYKTGYGTWVLRNSYQAMNPNN